MTTFSQRAGLEPLKKSLQQNSLDSELRNQLWNALYSTIFRYWYKLSYRVGRSGPSSNIKLDNLYSLVWTNHLKLPLDSMPDVRYEKHNDTYNKLRSIIINGSWNKALDLIEFIAQNAPRDWSTDLINKCNECFEIENSAYRFVDNQITEITNQVEIESIEAAVESPHETISLHFFRALELLSDRASPDYRNSIKESISAVEFLCKTITNKPSSTLGECLNLIEKSHHMHAAFKSALSKLYGYTNDEGGIRHALKDDSVEPTFADAKFMLVSCSAFVNFLLTVAAEKNIPITSSEKQQPIIN